MFNKNKLCGIIKTAGITMEALATILGIDPATLSRKINEKSDFTRIEMQIIKEHFGLSSEDMDLIFFAPELA